MERKGIPGEETRSHSFHSTSLQPAPPSKFAFFLAFLMTNTAEGPLGIPCMYLFLENLLFFGKYLVNHLVLAEIWRTFG